ncbi:MAG: acetate/propionate family kinase [Pseudomonadota bacterium]
MTSLLTLNAGSSSIKFALYNLDEGVLSDAPAFSGQMSGLNDAPAFKVARQGETAQTDDAPTGVTDHPTAWAYLLDRLDKFMDGRAPLGVGHRVVHGGPVFGAPVRLSAAHIERLESYVSLAPGHQPHNLEGVAEASARWPEAMQTACFDTAFHRTQPRVEEMFALPRGLTDEGVIRYGFHGLSYDYIASTAPGVIGDRPQRNMIVAHLGAGASMCAIQDGKSCATTMGFSALDGLPMATRCGALDAGVLLHLLGDRKMTLDAVADLLHHRSGLLGVSGVSADMRVLEASDDPAAREAIDLFVHRAVREIGSLTAALGGLDCLVFTAGIGENSAFVRARIIEGLAWLGMRLDPAANDTGAPCLTSNSEGPGAWVIPTDEERVIAEATCALLSENAPL